jgi:hypothetical protein
MVKLLVRGIYRRDVRAPTEHTFDDGAVNTGSVAV